MKKSLWMVFGEEEQENDLYLVVYDQHFFMNDDADSVESSHETKQSF